MFYPTVCSECFQSYTITYTENAEMFYTVSILCFANPGHGIVHHIPTAYVASKSHVTVRNRARCVKLLRERRGPLYRNIPHSANSGGREAHVPCKLQIPNGGIANKSM